MLELLGFAAVGAFGIIAAIAEGEPQTHKNKLTQKSRLSRKSKRQPK